MSFRSSVHLEEWIDALAQRGDRLPWEIGAYLALEVCEAVRHAPAVVEARGVSVSEDGRVTVAVAQTRVAPQVAARAVADLLKALVRAAGSEVPDLLLRLSIEGPSDGSWDPGRLRDELEACLVPLNRSATTRVVSRLVRETLRKAVSDPAPAPPQSRSVDLDADLDALLDRDASPEVSPSRPFKTIAQPPSSALLSASAESTREPSSRRAPASDRARSMFESEPFGEPPVTEPTLDSLRLPTSDIPPAGTWVSDAPFETQLSTNPILEAMQATAKPLNDSSSAFHEASSATSQVLGTSIPDDYAFLRPEERTGGTTIVRPRAADVPDFEPRKQSRRGVYVVVLFLLLVGSAGFVLVRSGQLKRWLLPNSSEPSDVAIGSAHRDEQKNATKPAPRRAGALHLRIGPERTQALLLVGRGPAIAEDLPVGVAHEFVAVLDGYQPTRAVVNKDAPWAAAIGARPRYELAMQVDEPLDPKQDPDFGASKLPRDVGSPSGRVGEVRVITHPPGALVYQLIGFAPDVWVRDVSADRTYEVVVCLPEHRTTRVVLTPEDFKPSAEGEGLVATVDVVLNHR